MRRISFLKMVWLMGFVGALTVFTAITTNANPETRLLKRSVSKDVVTKFDHFEVTVPADAADQEMTVEEAELDLNGISVPYSFKPVSKMFRFGPHGMKFLKGKELRFNYFLAKGEEAAKLYYINRDKKCLERVQDQQYMSKTRKLEARLRHFSDYVAGVESGWDGNGINPFFDYVHHGEEVVQINANRDIKIRSKVLTLKGYGYMDFNLAFERGGEDTNYLNPLKVRGRGHWDIPFMMYSPYEIYVYIPERGGFIINGSTGGLVRHERFGLSETYYYNLNGVSFKVGRKEFNSDEGVVYEPWVVLSDGTCIERFRISPQSAMRITDPKGNQIHYIFERYQTSSDSDYEYHISSITDSVGRQIKFNYSGLYNPDYTGVTLISNGVSKTILNGFTDVLGRTTTYDWDGNNLMITYTNGVRSEYIREWKGFDNDLLKPVVVVTEHRMYKPGSSTPFIKEFYSAEKYGKYVDVDNGICKKRYWINDKGYTTQEQKFSLSGKLIKQIDYNFDWSKWPYMVLKSQTTSFAKADGTLGPGATYAYSYDSWGNITCIKDPSGTETVMAYANTDSNKNLSTHNSLYQNAQYTTGAGWNQMVTKATLVKDEVHGTTQLKQTHYKYDSAGNLLQEDEVCGDGYRTTKYTYDSYGNMLTKTDANGNQLCFEYADTTEKPYKSAFLTRVYKPDNTTIATYDYDFDLGVKTMVTDPKGNIYRYKYDAIGRLTEEYLDTNDTKIGITRLLDYDDKNSTVTLKYGNDSSNFQLGRIKYDPLFGKAIELLRCSNLVTRDWVELMTEDWRTQKQFEYNSEGLVASETDGDGDSTSYIYDELGRKTVVNLPDGSTTRFEYDDRKLTTIDGKGNKQERLYDLLDRLVEVAEYPNPNEVCTTKYYYDTYYENSGDKPKYHLVKVVNPKNAATINTYDNLGRLVRTDYPQDGLSPMAAEVFTYDNVGNLKTKTNGKGTRTLDYEYFAGYRLKTITEADGRKISYTYDNNDNPLTQTTNGVTYTYTYDPRNRVTDFTARLDGNSFLLKYDYDAFGRVTSITYPGRTSPVTYTYDELDRLEMIPGFVDYCGYNGDNALEDMGLSNGIVNKYFYDHNNRPEDFRIKGQGRLLNLRYKYDEAGNIASLNDDCFEYDGMNRLIWSGNVPKAALSSKNFGNGMAWGCDGAGNITRKEIYQNSQLKENVTLGYDLANRLLKMGSTTYNNSDAGERLSKSGNSETWNYTYDGESRLLKVTKNSSTLTESFYDGVGMRYKKVSNGKTKYYIYSGSNPLVEYTPADGKYTYYIYAGQRSVAEEKDGKKIFYHRDHLGSTRALTDEDRKLVGLCKYDAWGNLESINAYDDYLINGDMENHDQYASERWQGFGDNCGESCFFATGDGIDGSDAIKLKRSSGETSTGWTMKDIFASPNTDYVLNGYFRSEDSNSTKAKAQMLYYDSNGVLIATHETVALGYSGTGWKEFTLNSHAPTNAASLEIRLTFDSGAGMTCYFDNVSLKVPGLQGKYDYTGKKEDEGTGLKYFGARFYDPEVGRFITVDPGKDGLNWYAYSDNNPINKFDPDGYSAKSATRSIWEIGIKSYLEKNGYNVTADLMRHSLQDNPSNLRYGQNSSIAQKIQDSKEWKDAVAGYISAFGGDLKQSHFKVEDSLRFKSGDLHLALNKVGYTIEGTKVGDKWNISVTMKDTFDFTTWNAQKSDFIANTANNLAYIDQKSGVINPYDIEVTFTQEVSTSDDSDSDDDSCYGGW